MVKEQNDIPELDKLVIKVAEEEGMSLKDARAKLAAELDKAPKEEEDESGFISKSMKFIGWSLAIGAGFFGVFKGIPYVLDQIVEVSTKTVEKTVKREVQERVEKVSKTIEEIEAAGMRLIMAIVGLLNSIKETATDSEELSDLAIRFGQGVWEDSKEALLSGELTPDKILKQMNEFVKDNSELSARWREIDNAYVNLSSKKELLAKTVEEVTTITDADEEEFMRDAREEVQDAVNSEVKRLSESMKEKTNSALSVFTRK